MRQCHGLVQASVMSMRCRQSIMDQASGGSALLQHRCPGSEVDRLFPIPSAP
jgi:hypothetical protein